MHRVSVILDKKRDPSAPARAVFYRLVEQGRIRLFHVGRASYSRETWPETVERIDREDKAQGMKPKAARPMPDSVRDQLTASHRRTG